MNEIPLTLGIEEEYQIIHPESRNLHSYIQKFLEQEQVVVPEGMLKPEFMQSQVEVGSHVCASVQDVRKELVRMRKTVADLATGHDLKIAAASTHPFAVWHQQEVTAGERYRQLMEQMQTVAAQLLIFGCHIHIGLGGPENNELKIEIMNQLRYFLPHMLALSTSSPFWQGRKTGLKSYRSVVFEMLPRTGLTPRFTSYFEYENFVRTLGKVGTISIDENTGRADGTKIWWDLRPHPRFGTLEVRIPDICTRLDDAVCLAAMVQSITKLLLNLRENNQSWRVYRSHHISENKWRAMRYGTEGKLVDFGREEAMPMEQLAEELLDLLEEPARELGCWDELKHMEKIIQNGTSADRQIKVYEEAIEGGASNDDALKHVVDALILETLEGI